jgi:iron complex outermembrane recepter protein
LKICFLGVATAAALAVAPADASAQGDIPVRADSARADSLRTAAVMRLGELRVHGARSLAPAAGTSALGLAVRDLRLPPAPMLDEMLREIPLMRVRANSRGEAEMSARGSAARQVAVLVDGVPLTLNWDARADASTIPATAPDEIRFSRGLTSMLHGPNVLGGVIEMTTAGEHSRPPRSARVSAGLEHTGGYGTSGTFTLPLEPGAGSILVRGGAGLRDSPGAPLAAGVVEPADGRRTLRLNTDSRSVDGFGAVRFRGASGAWLSGSAFVFRGERGVAAELAATAPRFWRYPRVARTVGAVSGGTGFQRTPLGTGDLEFSLGYDVGRSEIRAYRDRRYVEETGFENGDDRTVTVRLLGDHTLGSRGDFSAAYTFASIRHDEELPAGRFRYRQHLSSTGAETAWRIPDLGPLQAVRLSVGGAFDAGAMPATGDKPPVPSIRGWGARAGISAAVASQVQLHAGISRRGRFPALREAFSGALDRFAPNPDLGPEYLVAAEAGATASLASAQLQLVAFQHRLDDAIVRTTLADGRFVRINEQQVRSRGLELLASWASAPLALGADLTLQSARQFSAAALRPRPENQPTAFGSAFARAPLPLNARAGLHAHYTSRQFCRASSGDDVALAAGIRFSGDVSRQWRVRGTTSALFSRAEVGIRVDNLTDAAIYDQCGLPQPGRLASLLVRIF